MQAMSCEHMLSLSLSISRVNNPSLCNADSDVIWCNLMRLRPFFFLFDVAQAPFLAEALLTLLDYTLQAIWLGLMALTSLLLLLPPSHFTHTWHMASEQFNSANDDSPVWEAYRVCGLPFSAYNIWDRSADM